MNIHSARTLTPSLFWFGLFLLVIYRLWVLTQPHLNLFYDEIYYYHWSLDPALGYYSKPPMVAWFIGLSTSLFGDSSFGIKVSGTFAWTLTSIVVFFIGKTLWGNAAGTCAGLCFATTPLAGAFSVFATADAALLLFWSLSLWLFLLAQRDQRTWQWLLAGAFTGLGLLSKYTMIVLPFSYFLYLISFADGRRQFMQFKTWLAGIIALALFGLNLFWNYQNDFVSWKHTSEISQLSGQLVHPISLLEFLVSQLFIFGILSSIFLFCARRQLVGGFRQHNEVKIIALAGLTMLCVIGLQAFLSRAFANWAAPIFISASLLFAYVLHQRIKWLVWSAALNLAFLSFLYHYPSLQQALDIEPSKHNSPYVRTQGWDKVIEPLKVIHDQYPDIIIASDSRKLLAYSGYYLQRGENQFAYWNPSTKRIKNYYDQEYNLREWAGQKAQPFLFVSEKPLSDKKRQSFKSVEQVHFVPNYHPSVPKRSFYAYIAIGFSGYQD